LITQEEDKRNDLWYEAEVNAFVPPEPQYMHWFEASITRGAKIILSSCVGPGAMPLS
jgi:hypothetical protein